MALEGFNIPWERCVAAYQAGEAELKEEEADPGKRYSQLLPPRR